MSGKQARMRGDLGRQVGYGVVALIGSVVLGTLSVMAFASVALWLEAGLTRQAGILVNIAAVSLMIISYSIVLVALLKAASARRSLPFSVWLALAAYPCAWAVLMLSAPSGAYSGTPVVVNGIGTAVAWLVLGRRKVALSDEPTASPS